MLWASCPVEDVYIFLLYIEMFLKPYGRWCNTGLGQPVWRAIPHVPSPPLAFLVQLSDTSLGVHCVCEQDSLPVWSTDHIFSPDKALRPIQGLQELNVPIPWAQGAGPGQRAVYVLTL